MMDNIQEIYSQQSKLRIITWILRLLIAYIIITNIQVTHPRTNPMPAQTVDTKQPHVCVHTRLIDEVFEWKIQKSLILTREMGATTIVEFFPWAYFEGAGRGVYQWERADIIMRHAREQGLQVIARLGFVPEWARPDDAAQKTTLNYLPTESYADFADFAATFATRYRNTISAIIIWNEPNLSFEWGYRAVDPIGYTRLLQASYEAIKEVVPQVQVLAGALAPTLEPANSPNGLNDLLYLEAMYEAGAQDYFDGLAVHTYGFRMPPEAIPDANTLNFRRVELLHNLGLTYGIDKPVYITESGWNDHPRWLQAVTPGERAQYTVRALQLAEDWEWLETMCIWTLRYPADTLSYPDYYTLITSDFRLKPIYHAIQAYATTGNTVQPLWLAPPEIEKVDD